MSYQFIFNDIFGNGRAKKKLENCEKPGNGTKWKRRQEGNVHFQFVLEMLVVDFSLARMAEEEFETLRLERHLHVILVGISPAL